MTTPDDMTGNYVAVMRERGMTWGDLADQFERDANDGRALDGGANARRMARWARSHEQAGQARQAELAQVVGVVEAAADPEQREDAGRERREAAADPEQREPRPDEATPDPRKRTAVPPAKPRRAGATASGVGA